ncbi:MAG: hypothetical protein K8S62_03880 [Candidatus Sabulitectum sp.]|nr:hypothetical protein [Candidatus Sabulitectum sp.]
MHWKEMWDKYAANEREMYLKEDVSTLLERIRGGFYGRYYTIWYAVAERATAKQAADVLYLVLKKNIDYLYRYHAAAALIKLLGISNVTPVDLSGNHGDLEKELVSLADIMREKGLLH